MGSPPSSLLFFGGDNKRTTTSFSPPSGAIAKQWAKPYRCPHRFRREETPWAILHLHLQPTPNSPHSQLSTLNFHKEINQCN